MTFFDAINHSFTTMATGGYSTKQASALPIGHSPFIQYVIIFFMIHCRGQFYPVLFAIHRKFEKVYENEEFKYYVLFIVGFTAIIFSGLLISTQMGFEQAFRDSLFQVVSIITTTGYATADYLYWTAFSDNLDFCRCSFLVDVPDQRVVVLKIMRIVLLLKNSYYELRRLLHPNAIIPVRFNKRSVPDQIITNVLAFFMIYFIIFFISTILFMLIEPDLESAMGAVATSLGNIGPGLGNVGPVENFHASTPCRKMVLVVFDASWDGWSCLPFWCCFHLLSGKK